MARAHFIEAGLGLLALGLTTACSPDSTITTDRYDVIPDLNNRYHFTVDGRGDSFALQEAFTVIDEACRVRARTSRGERFDELTVRHFDCAKKIRDKIFLQEESGQL